MKDDNEKQDATTELVKMEKEEVLSGSVVVEEAEEEDTGIDMYVKFRKPYVFEDDIYDGIDLSCLENLSAGDMLGIEKRFYKFGIMSMNPENTATYAKIVAQKATGLPIEFFEGLPIREMLKIKSRVVNFFYG